MIGRVLVAAAVAATLSGCAYKPLKAPCDAEEGGVLTAFSSLEPRTSAEPLSTVDSCGPMRPI